MNRLKNTLLASACVLAAILGVGNTAYAQSQNGSVAGVITDSSGAVVSNAVITLTNLGTGATRTVTTTSSGAYDIEGLPPQDYTVTVTAAGFGSTTTAKFNISVGSSNTVNAKLSVKSDATVVDVAANSLAGINLENAENSQVIDSQQILELPTETRNIYDFASISGNASSDPTGTNRGVGVNFGGARSASTEILLDGIENTQLFSVGVATTVPVDAVQEFRVIASNYGPEYGRASGGVVNVVTKSGTNQFHGSAWEFYRPSTFASVSAYNKAYGIPLSRFVRNQFGFVVGGPIKKDKLFFFGGNEWLRVRSSFTSQFLVPTAQFLSMSNAATQSFFSTYGTLTAKPLGAPLTLGQIGCPTTLPNPNYPTCTTPGLYTNFSSDRVALEKISGFNDSTPIFQLVQQTAFGDAGGGTPQNTYNPVGRLDFNMTDRTQMYGRYVLFNQISPSGSNNVSPYQGYNTGFTFKAQNLVYGLTHSFSNKLTSQVQIGLLRVNSNQPLGDRPVGPTLYINSGSAALGGNSIALPGYSELSAANGLPSGGPQNNIVVSPVITYVKGAHTLTAGGQYTYIRDNHNFGIYENPQESLLNGGSATQGSLVNFQAGVFNFFQTTINPQGKFPCARNFTTGATPGQTANGSTAPFDPTCTVTTPITQPQFARSNRYQEGAAFVNDVWKATPRLTINAGLRYELYGTQHNKNSALDSNFYPGTTGTAQDRIRAGKILNVNAAAPAGVQSPNGKLWNINYKQFAPRVGFAYDLTGDGKTSLRGGYGISYERNFGNVTYNVALNPPGEFAISITNTDNGGVSFPISNGLLGPFSSTAGIQKALPQASARAVNPNIKPAYSQFYTLAMERQVSAGLAVGLTYVGTRGVHNYSIANYNRLYYGQFYEGDAAKYTPAAGSPVNLTDTNRLNNQYTGVNVRGADGDSYYNSVNASVKANDLYRSGLTVVANYTYGHSTDNTSATFASDDGSSGSNSSGIAYFDPFNKAIDHGNSDFDVKHRISLGLLYKTPAFGTTGFARAAVAGWEVGTQYVAVTGTPFTMLDSGLPQSGNGIVPRAHFTNTPSFQRTGPSTAVAGNPDTYNYISFPARTAANYGTYKDPKLGFADFPTLNNGTDTFGNMSARNTFRGPGSQTLNADLIKTIQLTERYGLQLRAELYNVLNHPNEYLNLGGGQNDVNNNPYISTYKNVGPTAGANRQLQLAAKFLF